MKRLIFGCGYLGSRVAHAWIDRGDDVIAVTRSESRAATFLTRGIQPLIGDPAGQLDLREVNDLDTVLFAVGFDRASDQSIHDVYVGGMRNVLEHLSKSVRRFIYISSTGVYSQQNGEWVDEESICEPTRAGGKACLAAEQLLQSHVIGTQSVILRLAGIYGPSRLPKVKDVLDGAAMVSPSHRYLNLIHVDDAVQAVLAADQLSSLPELLLISDGVPATRGEFYRELARLSHAPEPRFVEPDHDSEIAARASTDKRVRNRLMQERLSLVLKYPSYREGLSAILAERRGE